MRALRHLLKRRGSTSFAARAPFETLALVRGKPAAPVLTSHLHRDRGPPSAIPKFAAVLAQTSMLATRFVSTLMTPSIGRCFLPPFLMGTIAITLTSRSQITSRIANAAASDSLSSLGNGEAGVDHCGAHGGETPGLITASKDRVANGSARQEPVPWSR